MNSRIHHSVTASTLFDPHISSTQSPRTLTGSSLLNYLSNDSRLNSKLVCIPYLRVFRRIHHCFAQVGPSPFGHSLLVRPGLFNDLFTLSLTFVTSKLDIPNVSCSSVKICFFAFRQSTKSPRQTLHCLSQRKLACSPLLHLVAIRRRSFLTISPLPRGSDGLFPPLSVSALSWKQLDVIHPTSPGVAFGKYVEP